MNSKMNEVYKQIAGNSSKSDVIIEGIPFGHIETSSNMNKILRIKIMVRKIFPDINFVIIKAYKYNHLEYNLYGDYYKFSGWCEMKSNKPIMDSKSGESGHGYRKM